MPSLSGSIVASSLPLKLGLRFYYFTEFGLSVFALFFSLYMALFSAFVGSLFFFGFLAASKSPASMSETICCF